MSDTEVRIKMEGLQVGMYVSRVDKPWSDMPVLMEGLFIEKNEEIDMLNENCRYVYIDFTKGKPASPMYYLNEAAPIEDIEIMDLGKSEFDLLRKETYQEEGSLEEEMVNAKEIYAEVNHKIEQTLDDLKHEKAPNVEVLKEAVSETVDSVVRHPTAFKLVLELNKSDNYSYNHALGTSVWCAQFGRQLGLDKDCIKETAFGGLILDIGKTKIPDEVLYKKGKLSVDEIRLLRSHVDLSIKILIENEDVPHNAMRMVATHHERADSSGYPLGLENKEIPICGRIAGIVDSFDAMTSDRPFSDHTMSPHDAITNLYEMRGKQFQKDLVEQFIQTVGMYPTGTLVELNSGEIAVVTAINNLKRLRPTVMLVLNEDKKTRDDFDSLDLATATDYSIKRALEHGAYGVKMDELFI